MKALLFAAAVMTASASSPGADPVIVEGRWLDETKRLRPASKEGALRDHDDYKGDGRGLTEGAKGRASLLRGSAASIERGGGGGPSGEGLERRALGGNSHSRSSAYGAEGPDARAGGKGSDGAEEVSIEERKGKKGEQAVAGAEGAGFRAADEGSEGSGGKKAKGGGGKKKKDGSGEKKKKKEGAGTKAKDSGTIETGSTSAAIASTADVQTTTAAVQSTAAATMEQSTSSSVAGLDDTTYPPHVPAPTACSTDVQCSAQPWYCDYGDGGHNCVAQRKSEVARGCKEGDISPFTGEMCTCRYFFADPCMNFEAICNAGEGICALRKKIATPSPSAEDLLRQRLAENENTWDEEVGWGNYDTVTSIRCGFGKSECGGWDTNGGRNIIVEVRNGTAAARTAAATAQGKKYPTVPHLFDFIRSTLDEGAYDKMTVRYSSSLGYPEEIYVDYDKQKYGGETSILVHKIHSREQGSPDPVLDKCGWKGTANEKECSWEDYCCNKGCAICSPAGGVCTQQFCSRPANTGGGDDGDDEKLTVTTPRAPKPITVLPPPVKTTPSPPIVLTKPGAGIDAVAEMARLKEAMNLWKQFGSPDKYEFTFQRSCFCPFEYIGPFRTRVKGGKVISEVSQAQPPALPPGLENKPPMIVPNVPTVMEMFDTIRKEIESGPDAMEVKYHPIYGIVTSAYIDKYFMMADEEISFTVTNFALVTATETTVPTVSVVATSTEAATISSNAAD